MNYMKKVVYSYNLHANITLIQNISALAYRLVCCDHVSHFLLYYVHQLGDKKRQKLSLPPFLTAGPNQPQLVSAVICGPVISLYIYSLLLFQFVRLCLSFFVFRFLLF